MIRWLPYERVATGALGTVVEHILQGQGEAQALSVRDVQVRNVVVVIHADEDLVLGRVGDVVLLKDSIRSQTCKLLYIFHTERVSVHCGKNGTHCDWMTGLKLSCFHWLPVVGHP